MAYGNHAANFTPDPPQSPQHPRKPQYSYDIKMEKSNGRGGSLILMALGVLVCFTMVSAVIFSNVQQLQISQQITAKQKELTDLQSENVRMQSELAGKTSNKYIQEYAENVLGMRVIDASQIEYVQIQTSDVVQIPETEQNIFVRTKEWFDSLVEYLRG